MSDDGPAPRQTTVFPLRRLRRSGAHDFALHPGAEERAALADALGIEDVRKLRFEGTLTPVGTSDWTLEARLGATVVQACVITLAPVTTRLDIDVARTYLADFREPDADEAEMPEDETVEALPDRLDLGALMREALALALPDYPRAEGATLQETQFAGPGITPMTDEEAKPLAGLAALREALGKAGTGEETDPDTDRDAPEAGRDRGRDGDTG